MSAKPAEHIATFLSFTPQTPDALNSLLALSDWHWRRVLEWLDDAGLAFYLLQKLKDTGVTKQVPSWVLSQLEANFALNQLRVERMTERFSLLNGRFTGAGLRYVALKGLSLVPEFCPSADLRYQGDFDFLVDEDSLPNAKSILAELGYTPKVSRSGKEFIYLSSTAEPSRDSGQYDPQSLHAVELHLDIWDNVLHRLTVPNPLSLERTVTHEVGGNLFPALCDEDEFLVQVLHALNHVFTYWIRMSCLLEIAYFLNRRAADLRLWNNIERRIGESIVLREFVVVVVELASQLFSAPVPALVKKWRKSIRRGPRVWIESYAHDWAFCALPVHRFSFLPLNKLVRFLREQYQDNSEKTVAKSAPGSGGVARIARAIKDDPAVVFQLKWWGRQTLIRRTFYHGVATLRYAAEIPRWRWLNRDRRNPMEAQVLQQHRRRDFAEF